MKKSIIACALLSGTMTASSQGIYAGAALGDGTLNVDPNFEFSLEAIGFAAELDREFASSGFVATPILGYVWQWNRFYLGIEGQAFWASLHTRLYDTDGVLTDIGMEHEYVVLVRPGYQIFEHVPLTAYLN